MPAALTQAQRLALVQAALGLVRLLYVAHRAGEDNGLLTQLSPRFRALGERLADATWLAEVGNEEEREQALQDAAKALQEAYDLASVDTATGLLSVILYRVRGEQGPINPRR